MDEKGEKRQLRGRFRIGANEAVARGVRGDGRDADAPRWAGRRGRGSSSPRWGPDQGVTRLLFERRGRATRRVVSVGKASRKTSRGGERQRGRVRRTGDAEARFEPLHRHSLRDAAETEREMEERRSAAGARGGGAARGNYRDATSRRRSEARVCAYRLARGPRGFARRCSPPSSAVRKGCG